MTPESIESLLYDYQNLCHKVLHTAHLSPYSENYEDYFQELQLQLFFRAKSYESRTAFEEANDVTYLFRFLLWHIRDLQRKQNRCQEDPSDDSFLQLPNEELGFEIVETLGDIQHFYQRLNPTESKRFLALLNDPKLTRQNRSRFRKHFKQNWENKWKEATF